MTIGVSAKKILWLRDGGRCFYCGKRLTWKTKTADHVIPKSKGGPGRTWNLVLSCHPCNQAKGDRDPDPVHLDMVLRRKLLCETRISVGQAIRLAKGQRNSAEVARLLEMFWAITDLIEGRVRMHPARLPEILSLSEQLLLFKA